ncbi:hypothetical protein [Acidibrevibacterium fodinaquatile]|jgi:hypothetical protein|uniref:hypothetical protein n=1 Tax=Acidibrevibacterium fodinaquatile TaxID=1969806 RepID=UPI0013B3D6CF|nr:hypothetical protein [Acidibrevibacterium fodinaquatile]
MAVFTFPRQIRVPGNRPAVTRRLVSDAAPAGQVARPVLDLRWRHDDEGRLRAHWGLAATRPRVSLLG